MAAHTTSDGPYYTPHGTVGYLRDDVVGVVVSNTGDAIQVTADLYVKVATAAWVYVGSPSHWCNQGAVRQPFATAATNGPAGSYGATLGVQANIQAETYTTRNLTTTIA